MSLLDCICCGRHGHRTAVIWDDLLAPSCLSYSVLVEKGCRVACYLRHTAWVSRGGMVGLYGSNCPDVLCALLGILAVPAAYVPVDLAQPAEVKERTLRKLGIKCILVHYTFMEVMKLLSGLLQRCCCLQYKKWQKPRCIQMTLLLHSRIFLPRVGHPSLCS